MVANVCPDSFYFADQNKADGTAGGSEFSGEAHATAYWELVERKGGSGWYHRSALLCFFVSNWFNTIYTGLEGMDMSCRVVTSCNIPLYL